MVFDDDDYTPRGPYRSARKIGKPMGPGAPHIPNKAERKLLTRMMQKSGQTEEEVRSVKSNRQKLAAAAKSMSEPNGKSFSKLKQLRRDIIERTGLPHYDKRINSIVNSYYSHLFRYNLSAAIEKVLGKDREVDA